jgi:UDP-N-acetyl-D-galactosamine dehydrogenase
VVDIVNGLREMHVQVDVFDPWVTQADVAESAGARIVQTPKEGEYDAIVLAVAHDEFVKNGVEWCHKLGREHHVLYDVKSVYPKDMVDGRL